MEIRLNPDDSVVKEIREALRANDNYCPCSIIKNDDTKCMCKAFKEQKSGMCHCGLYIKIAD